ncbi:MAG: hypothetical protein HQK51_00545 [Oligoflexia bacterium]|nr:hypothetical protein [Oligoflexia bacterium]
MHNLTIKKIILLTGFMGSGKSFLLKKLLFNHKFNKINKLKNKKIQMQTIQVQAIDLDLETLQSASADSIESIGLTNFRKKEYITLKKVIKNFLIQEPQNNQQNDKNEQKDRLLIVALGGGALNKKTLSLIAKINKDFNFAIRTIWLDIPFSVCYQRMLRDQKINNSPIRPLMKKGKEYLKKLYEKRKYFYSQANLKLSLEEIDKIHSFKELLKYVR